MYLILLTIMVSEQFNNNEDSICDIDCKITIATICGCICALGCLFVVVWKTRRFKCRRNKSLKHVGSTASMSVIPSDYFDDRDYRTTHSSPQYGPYYKESVNGNVVSNNNIERFQYVENEINYMKKSQKIPNGKVEAVNQRSKQYNGKTTKSHTMVHKTLQSFNQ